MGTTRFHGIPGLIALRGRGVAHDDFELYEKAKRHLNPARWTTFCILKM
jgi:hypothetical protein